MIARAVRLGVWYLAALAASSATPALAQQLDMTQGGPVTVTARDGIDLLQNQQEVIARGDARAVRGSVTVIADQLIAHYRKKAPAPGAVPAPAPAPAVNGAALADDSGSGGNEIYRLEAVGNVRIFTATDQAEGDRAIYDLDQAVMVMTGHALKLTTPNEVLTARDDIEYWSQKHMAVARGDAVVVTRDARRIAADVLVAYTTDTPPPAAGAPAPSATRVAAKPGAPAATDDPLAASGKLKKMEAFGHVSVRTPTDIVTGDRAVYVPDSGIARLAGNVRITRGENQLNGSEAEVNLKTGISRLISGPPGRVQGYITPNDASNQSLTNSAVPGAAPTAATKPAKGSAK